MTAMFNAVKLMMQANDGHCQCIRFTAWWSDV